MIGINLDSILVSFPTPSLSFLSGFSTEEGTHLSSPSDEGVIADITDEKPRTSSTDDERRLDIVIEAAVAAVSALHTLGVHCAIFGDMACYLYGNPRVPNVRLSLLFSSSNPAMTIPHLQNPSSVSSSACNYA
ncbi:hypothetical protein AX17_006588 [Amanita inopinata Kibby_2008]|nr:hypothetical protein AX17_006588 [Amanita inopinata Kibby_2008]